VTLDSLIGRDGGTDTDARLVDAVVEAVGVIAGDATGSEPKLAHHRRRIHRRLVQLAAEVEGADALEAVAP
jgi:hypothetical protein